jgi:hypothetical protein
MGARVFVVLLSAAVATSGCFASGMASEGYDPGQIWLRPGTSRSDVERGIGPPITTSRLSDGRLVAVYEYGRSDPNRHLEGMHVALSIVTFGLWGFAGRAMERGRAASGMKVRVTVTYSEDGHIESVDRLPTAARARSAPVAGATLPPQRVPGFDRTCPSGQAEEMGGGSAGPRRSASASVPARLLRPLRPGARQRRDPRSPCTAPTWRGWSTEIGRSYS